MLTLCALPREYVESAPAQARAYRNRWRRRIRLDIDLIPESKNNSLQHQHAFQEEVAKQLVAQERKLPYRVPVALQIDFAPSAVNPPSIHSLAKNYLDLLQEPISGSALHRKRLLLQDDRLVKVLICNYSLTDDFRPGIRIQAATLNDFRLDLELYQKILRNDFSDADHYSPNRDRYSVDERFSDAIEEYQQHLSNKASYSRTKKDLELWERFHIWNKQSLQQASLKSRELDPKNLCELLGRREEKYPELQKFTESLSAMTRGLILQASVSIDFGAPAARKGDTKVFKEKVQSVLANLRKKDPYMFPLLTTVGVSLIYVPPKQGDGIDLDNLARKVIPFVHEELKPPSTYLHVITRLQNGDQFPSKEIRDEWARLKRAPADQVTRYQVFEVPRTPNDPDEGSIEFVLHSGRESQGPWHECDRVIGKWEN